MVGQGGRGACGQSNRVHACRPNDLSDAFIAHALLFGNPCWRDAGEKGSRNPNLSLAPEPLGDRII